ncbi:MAG: iron chaperone [Flavobacteriales bacterium]
MKTEILPFTVDEYIAGFPKETQELLQQVRACILMAAPEATEVISYKMPAYKFNGMLVYFAGYKNHIGFYPGTSPIVVFKEEIARYKNAKGSVQFPITQKMPLDLIIRMVRFKVQENLNKMK